MEFSLEMDLTVTGKTYKEVRENVQEKIDEFLKGTKGAQVQISIRPLVEEVTIAGFSEISAWECHVGVYQSVGGSK